ncbi:MAG: ATP-grasp domain-containing protein [Pseudomonadota bacterium]
MPTVLLTLGRLPKAIALVRALKAAGCRVLVADPFRWHVCKPSRDVDRSYRVTAPNVSQDQYLSELLSIVKAESVDVILPVSEEALHVAHIKPFLPEGVRLWSSTPSALQALHDKLAFVRLASEQGLPVPESHAGDQPGAAELAKRTDFIEKPAHSCSGIGLRFADRGDTIATQTAETVVQQQLSGALISSLSLVADGRELGTVFYRGRVFAGTVAICFERLAVPASASGWVSDFISRIDHTGFLAFDFILGEDGLARAIECNPRATSGVHFFDPASLGAALVDPHSVRNVAFTDTDRYQWAYSTLTETYAAIFKPSEFRRCFGEMLQARDVIWSWRDPLPFLLMTPMSWEILWPAMTSGLSLGEATQRDIAWFGAAP